MSVPPAVSTWSALAEPEPGLPAGGGRHGREVRTEATGVLWDAVAMPLGRGLAALDRMGLDREAGYPVLADHTAARLYVLVAPDTGHLCAAAPEVLHVLTRGSVLLVPIDPFSRGTLRARWLCPQTPGLLVPTHRLARTLAPVRQRPPAPRRPALRLEPPRLRPVQAQQAATP
jgi:hypothetical protein